MSVNMQYLNEMFRIAYERLINLLGKTESKQRVLLDISGEFVLKNANILLITLCKKLVSV